MRVIILDGYVDEPACLGVPPYISPYVRYIAGAVKDVGAEYRYVTVDQWRKNPSAVSGEPGDIAIILAGAIVPGKYIRGMPISFRETSCIAQNFLGKKILAGACASYGFGGTGGREPISPEALKNDIDFFAKLDADAFIYDLLKEGSADNRRRTPEEWKRWPILGAELVRQHPDFPQPLIVELETYRGCIRWCSGGCSFCMEPLFGEPVFRQPEDVVAEAEALAKLGAVNFRIGAQSCFFSYLAKGVGETETPVPNVDAISKLLKGIRKVAPALKVLHIDNANPAVIAANPKESEEIAKLVVEYGTPGNVAALGMESADPAVAKANNLNATAGDVMFAVEMLNRIGGARGENGMPHFLPGINIIHGLEGETKETYEMNFQFLKSVLDKGLMLRRINIRQVMPLRMEFDIKYHNLFVKYKEKIREEIDRPMLKRMLPEGTVLRDVYFEMRDGKTTFGRQIGTYPLLVGVPYEIPVESFADCAIVSHGLRSVTAVEYPLDANNAPLSALAALPGIGEKRAMRIFRARPIAGKEEFIRCMDDENVAKNALRFLKFNS
ncbi:MAG: radical SAM protein [Candidatus Thermoplasmatota archaeon]|nr:radical SAM protein [Candidatus Thermoplasmatota archaeon]